VTLLSQNDTDYTKGFAEVAADVGFSLGIVASATLAWSA